MIAGFKGLQLVQGSDAYAEARRVWNGVYDHRPALIAQCLDASDVRLAIAHARRHDLPLAVRGGGHSLAGHGVCEAGVVIDLRNLCGVEVDPVRRVARVGGGAKWAQVDAATSPHQLATPGGDTSTVGVAGLTLGGGLGWLSRIYGMSCDNLLGVELVTADGERIHADDASHPDLLWALRGGGGNFGVVTQLYFRLHPVPPSLLAGVLTYPLAAAAEVLGNVEALTPQLHDQVSWAAAFVVREQPLLALRVCYVGTPGPEATAALAPLRRVRALSDSVAPMAYTELQSLTDANAPFGLGYASRSEWLRSIPVSALTGSCERATSPLSLSLINPLGGAIARRPADSTAFSYRHAPFLATIVAGWELADGGAERHREWAKTLWRSLVPASAGGGYVNLLGDEGPARVRSAYSPEVYARLLQIKHRYDPENLFNGNQNLR
ncbi:MAG TPA: FAD-binding oxidoreductase [Polyangiaceae bacterium]|nr:FAD-binding oxidoreductase [Polyangiaceae bacterium]